MYLIGIHIIDKKTRNEFEIDQLHRENDKWVYGAKKVNYNCPVDRIIVKEKDVEDHFYIELNPHESELKKEHQDKTKNKHYRKKAYKYDRIEE